MKLKVHIKKISISPDLKLRTIARGTPGFSGADLANLINESALFAARENKQFVDIPCSNLKIRISYILKEEHFIRDYVKILDNKQNIWNKPSKKT